MKFAALVLILLQMGVTLGRYISNTDLVYNRSPSNHHGCVDACMRQNTDSVSKGRCIDCCHQVDNRKRWGMCIVAHAKLHVNLIHHKNSVI